MIRYSYLIAGAIVGSAGAGIIGVEAWLNVGHAIAVDGTWASPLGVAILAAAAAQAIAVPAMTWCWRARHYGLALFMLFGLTAAVVFSLAQTVERGASARDARTAQVRTGNQPHKLVQKRLDEAKAEVRDQTAKADAERAKGGCGTVCKSHEAAAEKARGRVVQIETELGGLQAPRTEKALAETLAFLPADVVDRAPALALPIILIVFGFAFVALAEVLVTGAFVAAAPAAAAVPAAVTVEPQPVAAAPRPAGVLPKPPAPPVDYAAALADVLAIIAAGGQIPAQKFLSRRWGNKSEATVSKWLRRMEREGHIVRAREGKARGVRAA